MPPTQNQKNPWYIRIKYFLEGLNTGAEREYIIENLSLLLSSGTDIITALKSIKTDLKSQSLIRVLDEIEADVSGGASLSTALSKTNLVSKHIIALITVGENSGRLEENLRVVAMQQTKDRIFLSKIRSALIYPGLVFGLMVIVGISISWFILPRLATVFSQLKIKLPLITKLIIGLGEFLGSYGAIVVPIFCLVTALIIFFLFFYKKTNAAGQFIIFHIPGIKQLVQELELAHTGFIIGTLLDAGMPIVDTLDSLRDASKFYRYKKFYKHIRDRIEEGHNFSESFASFPKVNGVIPTPIQQMIIAGEQSGSLSKAFLKIGEIYENKTETTAKNVSVILEPLLLIIVWVGVVIVALGVILPIYSLIGGINK